MRDAGGGAEARASVIRVRLQINQIRYNLGIATSPEEAALKKARAEEEFHRTGHITAVSCSHREAGTVRNDGSANLWYWSHFVAGRDRPPTFEENVMRGVMHDAVTGLTSDDPRVRAEARAWISRAERHHLYGFGTICDYFGVDVESAQETLLGKG